MRVISQHNYPNYVDSVTNAIDLLKTLCSSAGHVFWPGDISLRDSLAQGQVVSHKQITDLYLLALSVEHKGALATLDRSIPFHLIKGGVTALEIIN